jgi:CRP-like cAMP-binding protein
VATEQAVLILLERRDFLIFIEEHPSAAITLLSVLSRRLRRNAQIIEDAAFQDVPGRLARTLLELADAQGEVGPDGTVVRRSLTQVELASMIGATRESVNKWLGVYRRRGLVRYERGRLTILQSDELRKRI